MAEYYDYGGDTKLGYADATSNGLGPEAYRSNSSAYRYAAVAGDNAEFNPRADSPIIRARGYPPPPGADHPTQLGPPTVVAPRWWVSPAAASASPTTSYGGGYPQDMPTSYAAEPAVVSNANNMGAAVLHVEGALAQVDHFPADPHANNPYLTANAVPNRPTSTWHQQQVQQADWSEAGPYIPSVRAHLQQSTASRAATDHGERGVFHPVFSNHDQHPGSDHLRPQFALLNRLRASPLRSSRTPNLHSDSNAGSRVPENDVQLHCWPGSHDQGRLSVGKSQSMRALYEENAALRRALHSIRRGSTNMMQSEQSLGELDRCIASDVGEGRALSMRERGRWAMQATGDGSYPMWVGTPRQQWTAAAGTPFHRMQAGSGAAAHHRRPHYHCQGQWCADQDITAEHPLYYGGGSFGGWPESEPMCWDDVQNDCPARGAAHDHEDGIGDHQGTSLKQLLGGGSQKWGREGRKKGARRREVEVKQKVGELEGQLCAMCGGRLRYVEGAKSRAAAGGLPLRLCPACHPRAAASLPHSTKSPPALPNHRHHVATAVLMACRPAPGPAHHAGADVDLHAASSNKPLKARSSRTILDLCRHFVGLSTKAPPPST